MSVCTYVRTYVYIYIYIYASRKFEPAVLLERKPAHTSLRAAGHWRAAVHHLGSSSEPSARRIRMIPMSIMYSKELQLLIKSCIIPLSGHLLSCLARHNMKSNTAERLSCCDKDVER